MRLVATFTFLVDDCHPIEVVLREIQVLSRLVLHIFALVVVDRQLLDLETVLVVDLVRHAAGMGQGPLGLPSGLTVIIIGERDLGVALIGRDLGAVHVESVYILWVLVDELLLALPRVDDPCALHISFLSGACPPARHSLSVASYTFAAFSHSIVASSIWIWVEVIAGSGERWQDT